MAHNQTTNLAKGKPATISQISQVLGSIKEDDVADLRASFSSGGIQPKVAIRKSINDLTEAQKTTVINTALENPRLGNAAILEILTNTTDFGAEITTPIVQKILSLADLSERRQKWIYLETLYQNSKYALNADQIDFIERNNPIFADRYHQRTTSAGESIQVDEMFINSLSSGNKAYIYFAIDYATNYAWLEVREEKSAEAAVMLLHNKVLPHLERLNIQPKELLVKSSKRSFNSTSNNHPFKLYAGLSNLSVVPVSPKEPGTNGRITRFTQAMLSEHLVKDLKAVQYDTIEQMAEDLNVWIEKYNATPLEGYPNYGCSPVELLV